MGARAINFTLDKKFRGLDSFRSTNGEALFDDSSPILIIYDASIILIFNYSKNEVYNIKIDKPKYIKTAHVSKGILTYKIINNDTNKMKKETKNISKRVNSVGYGIMSSGKMPSAYP